MRFTSISGVVELRPDDKIAAPLIDKDDKHRIGVDDLARTAAPPWLFHVPVDMTPPGRPACLDLVLVRHRASD
jgi:hypothetical protein